ncbi:MAG: PHP domain-containing protein [Candidatus Limnocylindrales bacterium]|nr:PHP domain-containing protein [Candidatus Limnocylindrales bacterium]
MTARPGPAPRARRRRHDPTPVANPVIPPAPSPIDLHTHSRRSDGVLEPTDLVRAAAERGVTTFALTDHDTLAGYREVVAAGAVPVGVTLVPGVEINALVTRDLGLWEGELHILGFGLDPDDEAFEAALAIQREQRRVRFERTVDRLRELGLGIDAQIEMLARDGNDALGRPTIARALIAAGHATSVEDAFRRLLGHGCPAYVPRLGLGPVEAIAAIRAAGGLPALAHFSEAPARLDVVRELVAAGLGGLEVYYRSFDVVTVEAVAEVATTLGLTPTGGSDYHGDTGTYAEAHAGLWVPPEVGSRLLGQIAPGFGVP